MARLFGQGVCYETVDFRSKFHTQCVNLLASVRDTNHSERGQNMIRLLASALLCLSLAAPAAAQAVSSTTGTINGKVTDNTKAVLPGVTITITSPALMGTRQDVSDAEGAYRFVAIPPGDYKLTFELPGFATLVREDIRVGGGFTATVNTEMQLATQQETITVTGQSPVVDTQATKITTTYAAGDLANLPNARDFAAIMAASPAVKVNRIDVGGSAALSENSYRVYGTQGQDRPMVEGMLASEGTSLLFYTDYGSFQEVSVGAAANTAEMSGPGVFSQMIAKSGGNTYHGSVYLDYYGKSFQTRNIDDALIARGVTGGPNLDARDTNRTTKWHDVNLDSGGFLQKDKLWWYGSFRHTVNESALPNFPVKPRYTMVKNRTAKLTYNINNNNKLMAFINHNGKRQPDRQGSASFIFLDDKSTINQTAFPVGVWKAEWNWVISDAAFYEIRGGDYFYNWRNTGKSDDFRYEDLVTNIVSGGDRGFYNRRRRHQVLTSLSYFKNAGGTHNLKFGAEVMDEWYLGAQGGNPGDVVLYVRSGVPSEVALYETPNTTNSGLATYSFYATDTWQVNNRLTLNAGVRVDRYRDYLPEQVHPASRFNATADTFAEVSNLYDTNNIGPRVGGTYDVRGNGRTVVKGSFGVYRYSPGPTLFNPNPQLWFTRYAWTDRNNDRLWQPGEEGTLISSAGGITNESIDPDLEMASVREVATFFEHELMPNFGIRSGFVWRHLDNLSVRRDVNRPFSAYNVPATIPDPGPDGRVGTSDDGAPIAALALNAANAALPAVNLRTFISDDPADYYTWEITGNKRMSNRWSLSASFAKTWTRDALSATNPSALIFAESDGRRHFTNWQSKILSTLQAPYDIRLTPVLRMESGPPFARQIAVAAGTYGSSTILAEKWGARRLDDVFIVDLRAEKGVPIGRARVSGFLDLFNLTNANPVQTVTQTSGASFLRPLTIVSPRVARIGFKLEY